MPIEFVQIQNLRSYPEETKNLNFENHEYKTLDFWQTASLRSAQMIGAQNFMSMRARERSKSAERERTFLRSRIM